MYKPINTALIGFGMSGQIFHAPFLFSMPEFNLSSIYTNNSENAKLAHATYPDVRVVNDVEEIMRDKTVELVVVATPNASHFHYAERAMILGKHVVIEKPFTITSWEADELILLAHASQRMLTSYQNRRWDSDFLTVKKIIESGQLGNLVECEIHFDRYRPKVKDAWREKAEPGSGVLYDLGSHLIDQALVLFGIPKDLTADLRIQRPEGRTTDSFTLVLNYGTIKVTLKAGMLIKAKLPRFILHGEMGSFVKYGMDVQASDLEAGHTPATKSDWGKEDEQHNGTLDIDKSGADISETVVSEAGNYGGFYKNIAEVIRNNGDLAVTPEQARNTIRLLELAEESAKSKKTIEILCQGKLIQ